MEKKLEDIQAKKQILEKVLKEKNTKANTLQEEVYVLKERLSNAQTVHKRELETEKQKVCCSYIIQPCCFGLEALWNRQFSRNLLGFVNLSFMAALIEVSTFPEIYGRNHSFLTCLSCFNSF